MVDTNRDDNRLVVRFNPATVGLGMDWLGSDFPFSSSALEGKHAIVCGASKGIEQRLQKCLQKQELMLPQLVGIRTTLLVNLRVTDIQELA